MDGNNGRTIMGIIIIIGVVFSLITIYKLKDYPKTDCCRDIKNADSTLCHACGSYKWHEKIIYVWKYPGEAGESNFGQNAFE